MADFSQLFWLVSVVLKLLLILLKFWLKFNASHLIGFLDMIGNPHFFESQGVVNFYRIGSKLQEQENFQKLIFKVSVTFLVWVSLS